MGLRFAPPRAWRLQKGHQLRRDLLVNMACGKAVLLPQTPIRRCAARRLVDTLPQLPGELRRKCAGG
jgi:hypothetical protein